MNDRNIIILSNDSDWSKIILNDAKKISHVKLITNLLPISEESFWYKIARVHFSIKINKIIPLPFKQIWYKTFIKYITQNNSSVTIIMFDRNRLANDENFLKYLKKHGHNIKLIYIFTNVVKYSGAQENNFIHKLETYYDIIYAFDKKDSKKYGYHLTQLPYSLYEKPKKIQNDTVFFIGKAKDRLDKIIGVYKRLEQIDIGSVFYINEVSIENQQYKAQIHYNKKLPYSECIKYMNNASCILEIVQSSSDSFTLRVCEAIYYNKLLITNNKNIKSAPFYNPNNILVIEKETDINKDFFENEVRYSEKDKDYFSVKRFLGQIKDDIKEIRR